MVPSGPYFLGLPLFFFTSSPPLPLPLTLTTRAPPPPLTGCGMPGGVESGRYMASGGMSAGFIAAGEAPGDAMGLKASGIPCMTLAEPGGIAP